MRFGVRLPFLWLAGAGLILAQTLIEAALANVSVDYSLHDTYYVVADFHYVLPPVAVFLLFAGVYAVFKKVLGVPYNGRLGAAHFWLTLAGALARSAPGLIFLLRSPDLILDDPGAFTVWNRVTSAGYLIMALSLAVFVLVVGQGVYRRFRTSRER